MEAGDGSSEGARRRLIAWLGELGDRWGLPADACRVHGHLYFNAAPASVADLSGALGMSAAAVGEALAWLGEQDLVREAQPSQWRTSTDPWELMTIALEHRRARELPPALDLLRSSRRDAAGDAVLARQIGKLLDLVEDLAAIDAQARRLSPATLRSLLGIGGRVARLIGPSGGRRP
jgi:DNA-binding transcriptional regulator GbsR (MarR family)